MRWLVVLCLAWSASLPAAATEIVVFYLGAPDCPYCAHWESQSRPALLASPEARAFRYVEVRGETLKRPIVARHYPPEYRWAFDQIGPSRGVPRFLLAIDGKVVLSAYGTGGYTQAFLPRLREAVAHAPAHAGRFDFGVLGDLPYDAAEERRAPKLAGAMSAANLAFVVHVGDLMTDGRGHRDGDPPCEDETLAKRKAWLDSFRVPVILTPGDNDWTDCHYWTGGLDTFDPLERLAALRGRFFSRPTLGQGALEVRRQSDAGAEAKHAKYVENLRWVRGGALFVTLHMVGSNNNLGRDARMDAEHRERNAANLEWLREAFETARRDRLRGVAILAQANPFFEDTWPQGLRRTLRVDPAPAGESGYTEFLRALEREVAGFDGPVAYVHGDTHFFRVDRPLYLGAERRWQERLVRAETFGSPRLHWLRVTVDPADPGLFSFRAELMPE